MTLSETSVPGVCAGLVRSLVGAWPWGEVGPLRVQTTPDSVIGTVASLPTSSCLRSPVFPTLHSVPCLACHYFRKFSHSELCVSLSTGVDLLTNHQLLEIFHNVSCINTSCFHPTRVQKLATIFFFISVSCKDVKSMTNYWKLLRLCVGPQDLLIPHGVSSGLETVPAGSGSCHCKRQPRDQSCGLSREHSFPSQGGCSCPFQGPGAQWSLLSPPHQFLTKELQPGEGKDELRVRTPGVLGHAQHKRECSLSSSLFQSLSSLPLFIHLSVCSRVWGNFFQVINIIKPQVGLEVG